MGREATIGLSEVLCEQRQCKTGPKDPHLRKNGKATPARAKAPREKARAPLLNLRIRDSGRNWKPSRNWRPKLIFARAPLTLSSVVAWAGARAARPPRAAGALTSIVHSFCCSPSSPSIPVYRRRKRNAGVSPPPSAVEWREWVPALPPPPRRMGLKKLFQIPSDVVGKGKVLLKWNARGAWVGRPRGKHARRLDDMNARCDPALVAPPLLASASLSGTHLAIAGSKVSYSPANSPSGFLERMAPEALTRARRRRETFAGRGPPPGRRSRLSSGGFRSLAIRGLVARPFSRHWPAFWLRGKAPFGGSSRSWPLIHAQTTRPGFCARSASPLHPTLAPPGGLTAFAGVTPPQPRPVLAPWLTPSGPRPVSARPLTLLALLSSRLRLRHCPVPPALPCLSPPCSARSASSTARASLSTRSAW